MSKERMDDIKEAYEMNKYDENYGLGMKDIEWLIEQAERVHELEENNKNLKVLRSINRKERMIIHEQNKRYREALNEIKQDIQGDYTEKELSDYPLLEVIVEQIDKLLERDTGDRTVESPHSSWF